MSNRLAAAGALVLLACGGRPGSPVPQDNTGTPEVAVQNFMQAVADSNIPGMARFWGTARGSAAATHQPSDYVQRLGITQIFLRRSPYKILRADPDAADPTRHMVQVEFTRTDLDGKSCARVARIGMVRTGSEGWIVTAMNLNEVGTPGRACSAAAPVSGN